MSADSRLNAAFTHAPAFPLCRSSRYVLFSDCHRGCGTNNDNFLKNQNLYFAALQHYYNTVLPTSSLATATNCGRTAHLKRSKESITIPSGCCHVSIRKAG